MRSAWQQGPAAEQIERRRCASGEAGFDVDYAQLRRSRDLASRSKANAMDWWRDRGRWDARG